MSQVVNETFQSVIEKETCDLMDITFTCICGETHSIPIKYLTMERGSIHGIKEKIDELGISGKGALIFDKKIGETVVSGISKILYQQGIKFSSLSIGNGLEKIDPEVPLSQKIAHEIDGNADYLISAGSGVISDLVKYAAHLLNLPCILIPTAPSMNGYTSSMAALTDRGIKKTLLIKPPKAIFADIDILSDSPIEMIRSGLGDILSKSVCNADWKLSGIIKKTYFCPLPFRITDKTEPLYLEIASDIGKGTEKGIRVLTDGIMRSGLSMTVIGTSTPSSGAEHIIPHYWDLMALKDGKEKLFHGTQVGVATIIVLKMYEYIRKYKVKNISTKRLKESYPGEAEAGTYIDKKFGKFAEGVREEYFKKFLNWREKEREIEFIIENWDYLWNELDPFIRPTRPVEDALKGSGSAVYYYHLGKSKEEVFDSLLNAPFIRNRYTILDLAKDLGLLEEAMERVVN